MTFRKRYWVVVVMASLCTATIPRAPTRADEMTAQRDNPAPLWCTTSQAADNGLNDWVKLPEQSIHIVRAPMQDRAKNILATNTFVEMAEKDVLPYLRDGENVTRRRHFYLAQAAAYHVNEKYELPKPAFRNLPFDASYSPSRDPLTIVNFALGYAGVTPSNLALVIEVPNVIGRSMAVCLRTQ
jgi:hypothetical protein